MNVPGFRSLYNAEAVSLADVPRLPIETWRESVIDAIGGGLRMVALWGSSGDKTLQPLWTVLADDEAGRLWVAGTEVRERYRSLTPRCPQAHLFERELAEQWDVKPEGHPWLKPVRFTRPGDRVAETDFFAMDGAEVHEVAVGPVHAGIIEPGHFRFQCHGELVHHLEIALGFQHRGVERAIVGGPNRRTRHLMQTLAGDTTIGHSLAYARNIEALGGIKISPAAQAQRGLALELERLANHVGDLGALAGDVGYQPTLSFCGRLRGDILNLTAFVCGSRFGREWIGPGGSLVGLTAGEVDVLRTGLEKTMRDITRAVDLLWSTPSVMARFEGCGALTRDSAQALGLVGPVARACGLARDVRINHPVGIYALSHLPVATHNSGDVFARAWVRWLEVQRSVQFIYDTMAVTVGEATPSVIGALAAEHLAVSLVEGWRGEICHVVMTDPQGRLATYKIVDPSFHNWTGLAQALRGQQISDFPLCNKSMNLSYCGHDL